MAILQRANTDKALPPNGSFEEIKPKPTYDVELAALLSKSSNGISPEELRRYRQLSRYRMKQLFFAGMALVVAMGLVISMLGLPFPQTRLPMLGPLPANPKRAFATLHSDSNPCYDMLLFVSLSTWKDTNSKYPMLVLHSVPLPERVLALIASQSPEEEENTSSQAGRLIPVAIEKRTNRFVVKNRVRSAAAKFAAWDQTEYDQVAYHDSDFVFYENGDSIFDAPIDGTGDLWMYALPYQKYWAKGKKVFNSGNFLLRPNKAVYQKIVTLFQQRFWILDFQQFLKTADQGFLNAIFPWGTWNVLDATKLNSRVKHVKFWLALAGEQKFNVTEQDQAQAKEIEQRLGLQDAVDACLVHRAYSN